MYVYCAKCNKFHRLGTAIYTEHKKYSYESNNRHKLSKKRNKNPGAAWHEKEQFNSPNYGPYTHNEAFKVGYALAHAKSTTQSNKQGIPNPTSRRNKTQDTGNMLGMIAMIALPVLLIYAWKKQQGK